MAEDKVLKKLDSIEKVLTYIYEDREIITKIQNTQNDIVGKLETNNRNIKELENRVTSLEKRVGSEIKGMQEDLADVKDSNDEIAKGIGIETSES